jgi:RNA polymerase sigma-70 factor (ECF subfamily)
LKFFVADEADRDRAHKRGGAVLVPLEFTSGEARYQREPAHDETPEQIFERRWAIALLDRVLEKLRNEFVRHGRPEHFDQLKACLLGRSVVPYAALARDTKTSEGALKVAIHRLRKRYRELLRQEIADTVADPSAVESELRSLAAVLAGKGGELE